MDILLNPNVAYLFLVAGILLALMALVTPGTGLLELGAFFSLAVAAYGIYSLAFNPWAFVVLVLSLVPFLYALRFPRRRSWLLVATIFLVVAGSAFLFTNEEGWPAVSPVVAGVVSIVFGGFLFFSIEKGIQAMHKRPDHDLEALVGVTGEAKTDIFAEGSVQAAGELWTAHSLKPIPAGSMVRIVAREGFALLVEKIE